MYKKTKKFLPFEDARKFVHSLNLKSQNEWEKYRKSTNKPHNIPTNPNNTYKNKGWLSMGDWLGTGKIADQLKKYLSFNDAKKIVHKLNLKTQDEWEKWWHNNKPNNIPISAKNTYKNKGWKSIRDWLGNSSFSNYDKSKSFLNFKEAKKIVHKLNLKSNDDWKKWWKENKPANIPHSPSNTYKNKGWLSMGDWLGHDNLSNFDKHNMVLSFKDAKDFVHKLNLKTWSEWYKYRKSGNKPHNLPAIPERTYKNEFISYSDYLGYIGNGKHPWFKSAMISFLKSLQSELTNLDSIELITIINSNNLSKKLKELGSLEDLVSSQPGTIKRKEILFRIYRQIFGMVIQM